MRLKNSFGNCSKCGKQIMWIKTKAGKNMPCNPSFVYYKEQKGGKDRIVLTNGEVAVGTVQDYPEHATGFGYISHFATCEAAQMFRKKKKGSSSLGGSGTMGKINDMVKDVHETAVQHGWWDKPSEFGTLIALCHSELSEALEEYRKGKEPTETYYREDGKPEGIPSELADTVIRIMDMCGYYGIDLEAMLIEKAEFNKSRSYRHGGKKI